MQAKQNLFYIDHSARYLIIGRVYDMETQGSSRCPAAEMNPDMLIGGGGAAQPDSAPAAPTQAAAGARRRLLMRRSILLLAALPTSGAVTTGRGKHTVTVFDERLSLRILQSACTKHWQRFVEELMDLSMLSFTAIQKACDLRSGQEARCRSSL